MSGLSYNSLVKKDDKKQENKEEEEGRDLCPKCGNLMIEEGGEKTCSSCSEDIDFFGEEEPTAQELKES